MTSRLASRCFGAKISGSTCSSSTSATDRAARPLLVCAAFVLLAGGCGVTVKRDLSETKAADVVFDDLCGLQEYFDALKDTSLSPPAEAFANDIQAEDKARPTGGRKRFRFETDFQLHYLRQILDANWKSVPIEVAKASKVELEVSWSEKAGVARVVTDDEALLSVGPQTWNLPYHVCLSDLLFGESLYNTRRSMLNLPEPAPSRFSTAKRAPMVPLPPPAPLPPPSQPASMPALIGPPETAGGASRTTAFGRVDPSAPPGPGGAPLPGAPAAASPANAAAPKAPAAPAPPPPAKVEEEVYSD